ncbi:MAG: hypothetical protein AAF195_04990 [Pseudomonadota bacterium]
MLRKFVILFIFTVLLQSCNSNKEDPGLKSPCVTNKYVNNQMISAYQHSWAARMLDKYM